MTIMTRLVVSFTTYLQLMRWVRLPGSGYEFHFISSPSLANPDFSFDDYVAYTEGLYGNLSQTTASTYDQVGFSFLS